MVITANYIGVLVAALGSFFIGFMWFGPLFGKIWMDLMKFTPEHIEEGKKQGMMKPMLISVVSSLVSAFVFFSLADALLITNFAEAVTIGFWIWLGFSLPIFLNTVLWEGKSWKLFWLSSTHILAAIVFTAAVYSWFV
jgi:hypothetical protein